MRSIHPGILPAVLVMASVAVAQPPSIVHEPVACAVAEKFPRLTARFEPPDNLAVARLVFQGQSADWYSVVMKSEGSVFAGVLPKPRKDLKSFRYYIEVTDKALGVSRTTEYTTAIVPSAGACKGGAVSASVASASVVVQGPAGSAALPPGFAAGGVVAGAAAGTAVAGAAIAGSGGLSGGALVGIVAGIGGAAAAGVAVAGKSGFDSGPGPGGPSPTPEPTTTYTGSFAGQRTIQQTHVGGPGGCQTITATLVGTMRMTLTSSSSGTVSTSGTYTVVSNTGSCSGQGNKVGDTAGIGWNTAVTGGPANLVFSAQNESETVSFSGALSGGSVSGTVTFTHMLQTSTTTSTGVTSIPVTLR